MFVDEQLRLADGLMGRGHYDLAIEEYQNIIKRFPDDPLAADAWSQLAEALSAKGRYNESISAYNQFFKKFSNVASADSVKIGFAKTLSKSGKPEDSEKAFSMLKEISESNEKPENLRDAATYSIGKILFEKGQNDKGIAEFKKLLDKGVSSKDQIFRAYGIIELASALKKNAKTDESIKILTAVADNRNFPPDASYAAMNFLASIYAEQKNYAKAAEIFEQIRLTSTDPQKIAEALLKRLECLYYAGEFGKLVQEADSSLKASGEESQETNNLLFLKASALQKQNLYQPAIDIYTKIFKSPLKEDELTAKVLRQIIQCLISDNRKDEAVRYLTERLDDNSIPPQARLELVKFVADNIEKNDEKLKAFFNTAVKTAKSAGERNEIILKYAVRLLNDSSFQDSLVLFNVLASEAQGKIKFQGMAGAAVCLKSLGREDEALQNYGKIITGSDSKDLIPEALFNASMISIAQKKNADARKWLELLREKYPESLYFRDALFYLGYLSFAEGQWDVASECFKKVSEDSSSDQALKSNALFYLGWSVLNSGKKPEAMKIFEMAVKNPDSLKNAGPELLSMLGDAYLEEKNAKSAKNCFVRLSGNTDLKLKQKGLIGLGLSERLDGNTEESLKCLREAEKMDCDPGMSSLASSYLGELLAESGSKSEAVVFFEKCVDNPVNKVASARSRLGLAKILADSDGYLKTANRYAMSVFILNDDPSIAGEAMILSIRLSLKMENIEEAKKTYAELSRRFPDLVNREELKIFQQKPK